jgi:hypothetical protein
MAARINIDPDLLVNTYQRTRSLRSTGRELGLGHMVVRNHLTRLGIPLIENKTPNDESLSPTSKVYLRPSQIERTDALAQEAGLGRHEMARQIYGMGLDAYEKQQAKKAAKK